MFQTRSKGFKAVLLGGGVDYEPIDASQGTRRLIIYLLSLLNVLNDPCRMNSVEALGLSIPAPRSVAGEATPPDTGSTTFVD